MKLRPYQEAATSAIFDYLSKSDENALAVLPTATGKSLVLADICRQAKGIDPYVKIIIATHSQELVAQNAEKLLKICPGFDIGIFSSGLGRKQRNCQFTFAGIQSIYKHAFDFGKVDLLCIDEIHSVPLSEVGTWRKFIADLKTANPSIRTIGLSATPFRMTQGNIFGDGEEHLFKEICYEYDIIDAIEDGYITPLTNRPTETYISTEGVHKRGGEFIQSELNAAVNVDKTTQDCVTEILQHGTTRNCGLIFCSGVEHSFAVRDAIIARGFTCETVTGKTPKAERAEILARFGSGQTKYITNNSVLTTGYDNIRIDLIACLRPTGSAGLWVQMLGRGFRNQYADGYDLETREGRLAAIANGKKPNCLILDFTQNTTVHGPIDKIRGHDKRTSGKGEAPSKLCARCFNLCPASVMICKECGYIFPGSEEPNLNRKASTDALLSNQILPEKYQVSGVSYWRHQKEGRPDTLRVDYRCGLKVVREWIGIENPKARRRAENWWAKRTNSICPTSIDEALVVKDNLLVPKEIMVRRNGKFDEIVGYEW